MKAGKFSTLVSTLMLVPQWFLWGSPLKPDEDVQVFPAAAAPTEPGRWKVSLHGWVFEKEEGSVWHRLATFSGSEALEFLGVSEDDAHNPRFASRFSWFLVDNERNKRIVVRINGEVVVSERSEANGHLVFPEVEVTGIAASWIPVELEAPPGQLRAIRSRVQLVPEHGTTVISDIDDTVKISEVLDRKALVKNIFANDYEAVSGMSDFYQEIASTGAFFHYLSASPWQLYPDLASFLELHFPLGTLSLRHFRLGDQSFWDFFHSSMDYKLAAIRKRILAFPKHRFVLVGDSGERDPEIYTQIQSEFPQNIERIFIRKVPDSDLSEERIVELHRLMPEGVLYFFDDPNELARDFLVP